MTIFHVIKYNELTTPHNWGGWPKAMPEKLRMYISAKGIEYREANKLNDLESIMNFYREVLTEYEGPL